MTSEKRNILLLATAQALFQSVAVLMITASAIIGLQLAPDPRLATMPPAVVLLASTITMIPASLLMQRAGRKAGFLLGAALGCLAGITAMVAVHVHSFWMFIAASMLVGGYSGFANYYRFAAADAASAGFRSRAISWVVAGGVVAAFAGTNIVRWTQGLGSTPFLATYLALTLLGVAAPVRDRPAVAATCGRGTMPAVPRVRCGRSFASPSTSPRSSAPPWVSR